MLLMLHFVFRKPIYQQVHRAKQLKQQEHHFCGTFKVIFFVDSQLLLHAASNTH